MNLSWQQLKNEPAKAYKALQTYLELGAERNLEDVAKRTGVSLSQVKRYSTKYEWSDRARAFDIYQQQRAQEIFEQEIRANAHSEAEKWAKRRQEFREEAFNLGNKLMQRAQQMMRFPLQKVERKEGDNGQTTVTIAPARWNQNSIVHTIQMAMELKILSTGLTPGTHPLDDVDLENLSSEDLDAILKDEMITTGKLKN